jgi:hypothetical protein
MIDNLVFHTFQPSEIIGEYSINDMTLLHWHSYSFHFMKSLRRYALMLKKWTFGFSEENVTCWKVISSLVILTIHKNE